MTQGELEKIPLELEKIMSDLEERIMEDIVRKIEENGFSGAASDWQISRLVQLGKSEEDIKQWIKELIGAADRELDIIFSDRVYAEYYGHERAYRLSDMKQVPYGENKQLQSLVSAISAQTKETFRNMTGSLGFVTNETGKTKPNKLKDFYQNTLDNAIMDIHSGAFDYNTVLKRTINTMTKSGLRWIDYDSGYHSRVEVAARRAVMTGFRQVQGKINEQVAKELKTDYYEITYHVGARPTHQVWQGRVWNYRQLEEVCGLGSVTGLHGANCSHDYDAFIPGVSVRTYTDEQLEQLIKEENTPKEYNGRQYTTYEALQQQRKMERCMRKSRQDINLLQKGNADENEIIQAKAKYQGQMQNYKEFSKQMKLPEQMTRVYQDGLKGKFLPSEKELENRNYMAYHYNKDGSIVVTDDWCNKNKISIPSKYKKFAVIDTKQEYKNGFIQYNRSYYDSDGVLCKQVHASHHNRPDKHNLDGEYAHIHIVKFDKEGKRIKIAPKKLSDNDKIIETELLRRQHEKR